MPPRRRKPPRAGALTELPPLKIIRSIILLQISYYLTATILIVFTTVVLGQKFSFPLILDWRSVRGDTTIGWTVGFAWLLAGFITVIPLLLLVSRSKLVPDFALTVHFIHLVVTSLYARAVPTNLLWWALQTVSATLLVMLGIWACRYRELQPISFGVNAPTNKATVNGSAEVNDHVRGAGARGRNADGGPSYEMVGREDGAEAV